jgi:hypothetical protein
MRRPNVSVVQGQATFFGLHMIYCSSGPYFDRTDFGPSCGRLVSGGASACLTGAGQVLCMLVRGCLCLLNIGDPHLPLLHMLMASCFACTITPANACIMHVTIQSLILTHGINKSSIYLHIICWYVVILSLINK